MSSCHAFMLYASVFSNSSCAQATSRGTDQGSGSAAWDHVVAMRLTSLFGFFKITAISQNARSPDSLPFWTSSYVADDRRWRDHFPTIRPVCSSARWNPIICRLSDGENLIYFIAGPDDHFHGMLKNLTTMFQRYNAAIVSWCILPYCFWVTTKLQPDYFMTNMIRI